MRKDSKLIAVLAIFALTGMLIFAAPSEALSPVRIFIDGMELKTDASIGQPIIINNRTMVPLRAISEGLGMNVEWDGAHYSVIISSKTAGTEITEKTAIMGQSQATSTQLRQLLQANNPAAPDLVDLYLQIGREYGIRGDIAFCQAAKETGWWKFGGIVQPDQNNYCGLWATGAAATGEENLNGADPDRVWFVKERHGAFFDTPAAGVEAHIQHLYAYACSAPLPAGKVVLDPRFVLVKRGISPYWQDLGGKWAYPGYDRNKYASLEEAYAQGDTYGHSILTNYYYQDVPAQNNTGLTLQQQIQQLQRENAQLKAENARLKGF